MERFFCEQIVTELLDKIMPQRYDSAVSEIAFWQNHWGKKLEIAQNESRIKEFDDSWSAFVFRQTKSTIIALLHKKFNFLSGKSLLETGAGSGVIPLLLGKEFGIKPTLLDICHQSLEYARLVAKRLGYFNFCSLVGNLGQIPFPDNSFDVVSNVGVIEHYPYEDAVKSVAEMVRVTKPGGVIVIGVPNLLSPELLLYRMPKFGKGSEHYYSQYTLQRVLCLNDLTDVEVRPINSLAPSFMGTLICEKIGSLNVADRVPILSFMLVGIGQKPT